MSTNGIWHLIPCLSVSVRPLGVCVGLPALGPSVLRPASVCFVVWFALAVSVRVEGSSKKRRGNVGATSAPQHDTTLGQGLGRVRLQKLFLISVGDVSNALLSTFLHVLE